MGNSPAAKTVADADDPFFILNSLDSVVYDWDVGADRLVWGANVGQTLRGLPLDSLASGEAYAAMIAPQSDSSRYLAIFHGLSEDEGDGAPYRVQYQLRAPDGGRLMVEDFGRWFGDAEGRPSRAHGLVRVLSRTLAEPEQDRAAEAALGSRQAFAALVDKRCAEPRAADATLALLIVGVANAAEVNSRYGYDAGDELLAGVSRRLASSLRGGDRMTRFSGAKFALMVALSANDQPATAAARIARRASADAYATSAGSLRAVVHVGVALSPRHGRNSHLLIQRADEAYAQAQGAGEIANVYAAGEALAETQRRESWIADEIVAALNERRIHLAYQPIVPTRSGLPAFEEALVRLRLDDGAVLGPDAFVPAAEKLGLIELIDERVLELAVARLAAEPDCRLSVNVAMTTLRAADWFERLRDRLGALPGAAERLTVEMVETQEVGDVGEVARILARLKALGVRVAMDDFGAGHTSFRNLRHLGVDMVKIDGAFVSGLSASADDRFFVRTLAALAKHLGVVTVAEWVEDAEAAKWLGESGVDYLQGHHIGRAQEPAAGPSRAVAVGAV